MADLKEAVLCKGTIRLDWHAGKHMSREVVSAADFQGLLALMKAASEVIVGEYPEDDERYLMGLQIAILAERYEARVR